MSRFVVWVICIAWSGIASAAVYFNNSQGDNSFTNDLNWSGAISGTDAAVDVSGDDQAKLLTGETETRPRKVQVGFNTGTTGEMTVDGGDLTADQFVDIAYRGTATLHMNGGSVQTTLYDINLGVLSGSHGTINMTGGTMTADRDLYIGEAGTGVMTVSGGTVTTTDDDISLGTTSTGNGTLTVSGGKLTAKDKFIIGQDGTGVMNMYGGTNAVVNYDFTLGNQTAGSGTVTMTNGHMEIARDFIIGENGSGIMMMSGGTINVGGVFRVAEAADSSGRLTFSGGTITTADFKIQAGTTSPGMVAFSGDAKMIVTGNKASQIQAYIDTGYLTGAEVTYISTSDTTLVGEPPPPQLLHVSAFGAVPNDGQDDAVAIQAAVDAAGVGDSVLFDAGVYDLISSTNNAHILVRYKTGITLSGAVTNGVPATRLLRHVNLENRENLPQTIYNRDNTDITIENFIMDNSPRHTTAGTVVAKDPGGTWIRVQLFNDLPMNDDVGCYAANAWMPTDPPVFKNVRSLTYGTSPANWAVYDEPGRIMELNAGSIELDFIDLIDVGEIMSWHYGAAGDNMMYNGYLDGFTFRNIRVPNAINAFANLIYSRDVVLQDISLSSDNSCPAVGPRDGFHLSSNGGSLLIDNVDIEGVRLDPIVLRTRYGHIDVVTDSSNFHISALMGGADMPAGSRLGLWTSEGDLEYIEVSSATWNSTPTSGYDIVTSSPLPGWAGVGTELKMSAFMPDSALITGCDFKNNAGSDIICFVDNVTMSNNTHYKATDAAIHLGSNNSSAGVCGNNIKILDCVFTDCGWGGKGSGVGAISVENRNPYQTPKVTNLEIRGNTFSTMIGFEAIALRDVDGCQLSQNTFSNVSETVSVDWATVSNASSSNTTLIGIAASAMDSYDGRDPVYAVNGAGLEGDAHASASPVGQMWMGSSSTLPKWFKVDLGKSYDLDSMTIYNFNWAGYTSRGCRNVQIFYSNVTPGPGNPVDNPDKWTAVGSAFDLTQAPGDSTYGTTHPTQPDTVDLSVAARWVAIQINSHYGGSYCGLSEVRFWKRPVEIDAIGIVDEQIVLNWDSSDTVNYNVWTNSDLVSGAWDSADIVPGTGGSITWTSSVTDGAMLFYKVEQE